jgi:class 3 adenylate cyclase
VAARVQELATPGEICVSAALLTQVKNKVALHFEHLGRQQVKNITEPISVHRVLIDGIKAQPLHLKWLRKLERSKFPVAVLI